jgi:hypothetical protein
MISPDWSVRPILPAAPAGTECGGDDVVDRDEPDVSLNEDHGPEEDPELDAALDPGEDFFPVEFHPELEKHDVHEADEELMG